MGMNARLAVKGPIGTEQNGLPRGFKKKTKVGGKEREELVGQGYAKLQFREREGNYKNNKDLIQNEK